MSALLANGITKTSELRKAYKALEIPESESMALNLFNGLTTKISQDYSQNRYSLIQPNGRIAATFSDQGRLSALDISYKVPVSLFRRVQNAALAAICISAATLLPWSSAGSLSSAAWAIGLGGAVVGAIVGGLWGIRSWSEFLLKQNENGVISYQKKLGGELRSKEPVVGWQTTTTRFFPNNS